jgi:hypothetical protein
VRPYRSMRSLAGLLVCFCDGECPAGWTEKRRKGWHHSGGIKPPRVDFPVPAGGEPDPNIAYGG